MTRNDFDNSGDDTPALLPPLPGPLNDRPRGISPDDSRAMFAAAVLGLDLGEYDRRILAWISGWDEPTLAAIASIIHRARQEDPR
jgi:hypothetical protein